MEKQFRTERNQLENQGMMCAHTNAVYILASEATSFTQENIVGVKILLEQFGGSSGKK